ncbi:MAG TPA: SDR family NAD(P)-dependent oxidoreductase [Myxococcales bacterium]|nr:SDR family NAD(P)-dependent oxidoreductase [Myxococcales bacterium]
MKRVLVTGGAGFIGSHLCKALLDRGDEVAIYDNFDPFYPAELKRRAIDARARLFEADVRDEGALAAALQASRPDVVVHLASLAGVRPSLERPAEYMDVNARGTTCVLEASRRAGVRRFLLGSSSSVYGASAVAPFVESARTDSPESPYAASKVASEVIARTFHNLYRIEIAALRFFTVYGPRQRPDLAIHKFSRLMLAGRPLPFFGDGSSRRDYTWVDDIVAGVVAACDVPQLSWDVINLGGAQTTSLAQLVSMLEECLGVPAILDRKPAQAGDVPLTSADVTHAREVLGYAPKTPIREGLRKFAAWIGGEGRDWV